MANEEAKLFVAGLPDSISEDVLKQLFEATGGKVVSVSLPKDRITGRPRGFGFVTLATPQEAQAARDALDGSMQAGKSISVRPFQVPMNGSRICAFVTWEIRRWPHCAWMDIAKRAMSARSW